MRSFIKVCHRNGAVFVRLVYASRLGRASRVCRLESADAEAFGLEVVRAAKAARGEKPARVLKLRRVGR